MFHIACVRFIWGYLSGLSGTRLGGRGYLISKFKLSKLSTAIVSWFFKVKSTKLFGCLFIWFLSSQCKWLSLVHNCIKKSGTVFRSAIVWKFDKCKHSLFCIFYFFFVLKCSCHCETLVWIAAAIYKDRSRKKSMIFETMNLILSTDSDLIKWNVW